MIVTQCAPARPIRLAEQARDDRGDERGENDAEIDGFHAQPLSLSRSSTLMLRVLRNSTTRIARPIAASAAATVRMKNTNTWPVRVAEHPRERDEVEVDGEQHELDAHQQQDDVLAVQEDAGHAQAEQDGREHEVMRRRDDHGSLLDLAP